MDVRFKDEKMVFSGAKNFRELLSEVLEKKKMKITKTDWKNVAWPYYRAHTDGYNLAIDEIIELLKD